ncbi:MAG: TAXI family TRAP transporter solute-binding subunit [Beijerinckiaceae bacterium]
MKAKLRLFAAAAAFTALAGMTAVPATAKDIRIGAMQTGSAWYVFAATLEKLLEPNMKGTNIEIIARGGGVANPMVVQAGRAEVALSNVATAVWAKDGDDIYKGRKADKIRALVGGLNSVYVGVMVREDFIKKMGTDDLGAIIKSGKPVRIVLKPPGSAAGPAVDIILKSLGSSRDKIKKDGGEIIQVATPQIPEVIRNGKADVYVDTIIKGHPTITEVALTGDVRFVDLPKESLAALAKGGLNPGKYGPKWFKGQSASNTGADLGTVLIANAALSDADAYAITKTLIENAAKLGDAHAAWKRFNPENAWKPESTGLPLHPGAAKYYKERGWLK